MVHQNAQASPNISNALNNNSFGLNHRDNPLQSHIVNLQLLKILTVHTSSQTLHRSDNQLYLIITLYQTLSTIDYYSSHSHMHHCIIFGTILRLKSVHFLIIHAPSFQIIHYHLPSTPQSYNSYIPLIDKIYSLRERTRSSGPFSKRKILNYLLEYTILLNTPAVNKLVPYNYLSRVALEVWE